MSSSHTFVQNYHVPSRVYLFLRFLSLMSQARFLFAKCLGDNDVFIVENGKMEMSYVYGKDL